MAPPLLSYPEAAARIQLYIRSLFNAAEALNSMPNPSLNPSLSRVPLASALGRVLAEPLRADRDQPPFPRATRDGFACRAEEANSHRFLQLAGSVKAGEAITPTGLGSSELWEIMTGAPIPHGADAVFMFEHSERSAKLVRLAPPRLIRAGENIVPQGAEARLGDLLIPAGVQVGPAQIALAAQCGYAQFAVRKQPLVAILSTGDELVPVEVTPGPSQIRNSNSPMLSALVTQAGGIPAARPAVPDREPLLDSALAAAQSANLLLITGGISAGRFDLVEDALTRAGARFFFRGVAIQPGKPVAFGELPRQGQPPLPFFALPGNPISSAVTFRLFAAPVLGALAADSSPQPSFALARLKHPWSGKPGLTRFLPARCSFGLEPELHLVSWQGSGDIAAFARSNCFLVIPEETEEIAENSTVSILL